MEKIQKFQMGRNYFPVQNKKKLFHIVERFGKELTIKVVGIGDSREIITLNASLRADEHGCYECFLWDGMCIPAYNLIPEPKQVSSEEKALVLKHIRHDIEMQPAKRA